MNRLMATGLVGLILSLNLLSEANAGGRPPYRGSAHADRSTVVGFVGGFLLGAVVGAGLAARDGEADLAAGTPTPGPAPTFVPVGPPPRWVPGGWETRWAPSALRLDVSMPGYHDAHGNWIPAHVQTQSIQSGTWSPVWVSGHWE